MFKEYLKIRDVITKSNIHITEINKPFKYAFELVLMPISIPIINIKSEPMIIIIIRFVSIFNKFKIVNKNGIIVIELKKIIKVFI